MPRRRTSAPTHLLAKAALVADLPWDVHSDGEDNTDFPDISTGYQLMNHRDFEAHRMLGYSQTDRALRDRFGEIDQAHVFDVWP